MWLGSIHPRGAFFWLVLALAPQAKIMSQVRRRKQPLEASLGKKLTPIPSWEERVVDRAAKAQQAPRKQKQDDQLLSPFSMPTASANRPHALSEHSCRRSRRTLQEQLQLQLQLQLQKPDTAALLCFNLPFENSGGRLLPPVVPDWSKLPGSRAFDSFLFPHWRGKGRRTSRKKKKAPAGRGGRRRASIARSFAQS